MNKITFNTQFIKLSIALLLFAVSSASWSQINDGGSPVKSFSLTEINKTRIPVISVPAIDIEKIQAEDEIADATQMKAPRFGVIVPMQIGFSDGVWNELPNGDRIWRVEIEANQAKALNLYFDDFFLPQGSKLHVYSANKVQILGGFGSHNNSSHNTFATSLIYGDELIVEYFEPFTVRNQGRIQISDVNHAYRMITNPYDYELRDFGDSMIQCQVNVNCSPEGNGKAAQRDAVARILGRVGNTARWCTGTVMNNILQDCSPYFLTALHCADDGGSVASQADFNQWIFYFNYQATGCTNPGSGSALDDETVTGANVRAHSGDPTTSSGSDMLLLEFQNAIPASYNVFYAGWDRGSAATTGGYGIHHPAGDIKKISLFTQTTGTSGWNQGGVTHHTLSWIATTNGSGDTEGGSSGSALFNNAGQVIGSLSGGQNIDCVNDFESNFNLYGKMSYHWESNTTFASLSNLKTWLDPDNTDAVTMDGIYHPCIVATNFDDAGISAIINPENNSIVCDNTLSPEVTIKNFGVNTLSSATINYRINSGTVQTYNWMGLLPTNYTSNVVLPSISVPSGNPFVLEVYTTLPNGVPDTDALNDSLSVTAQLDNPVAIPFNADFASGIPTDITIVDPDSDGFMWQHNASVNGFGTTNGVGSMIMDNWTNNTRGTEDYAFLPSYDFSGVQGAFLEFDLAYSQYLQAPDEFSDGLGVLVSTDCGQTFATEYFETGVDLATAPSLNGLFVPTSDQWVLKNIDLSAYDGMSSIQIVFVNVGNYSQALYIDNINVNAATLSVEQQQLEDLVIYPNPALDVLNIKSSIQLEKVELYSVLGEMILESKETSQIEVNNLSTGVYLLMIYSENAKSVRRIVIE